LSIVGVLYLQPIFSFAAIVLGVVNLAYLLATLITRASAVTTLVIVFFNSVGLLVLAASYPWPAEDAAHLNRVDRKGWIGFSLTILISVGAVFPFVQPFNNHIFEPDTNLEAIHHYQLFFSTLNPDSLPDLMSQIPEAPYFDGHYVIYALVSGIIRALSSIGVIQANLQTGTELRIFTIM